MNKAILCQQISKFSAQQDACQLSGVVINGAELQALGQAEALYPIASCTKPMTGWLAWTLAREGLLDLDAPLSFLIPGLSFQDEDATPHLTLRDALVHRSGLPAHTWAWVYLDVDRETFFRERLPQLESAGPFRDSYRYSNMLYGAIGLACEKATGVPWETLIQELWTPLGMADTRHLTEQWQDVPGLLHSAAPAFHAQDRHPMAPSGEVMSSASDMGRWLTFLLKEKEALAPLWQGDQFIRDSEEGPLLYGLGWRVETVAGQRCAWHTGGCTGYSSLCLLLPDEDFGLCLLANTQGMANYLKESAFSILRKKSPEIFHAMEPAAKTTGQHAAKEPGRFYHPGYGHLECTAKEVRINGWPAGSLTGEQLWLKDYGFGVQVETGKQSLVLHFPGSPSPLQFSQVD